MHVVSRVCKYMDQNKRRMVMKAFIISQFNYCSLAWILHRRWTANIDELLIKDKPISIHQRNLQFLATEIFKVKNGVSTRLTQGTFQFVNKPCYLRNKRNWALF